MQAFGKEHPQLGEATLEIIERLARSDWADFLAYNVAPEALVFGPDAQLIIVRETHESAVKLDEVVNILLEQLPGVNEFFVESTLSRQRLTLPAGEAEELRYREDFPHWESEAVTWYVLTVDNEVYRIHLTCPADQADGYAPVFEKIGQSFQLIE